MPLLEMNLTVITHGLITRMNKMLQSHLHLLILLLFLVSCYKSGNKNDPAHPAIDNIIINGQIISRENTAEPKIIPAGKPLIVKAGKPVVVLDRIHERKGSVPIKIVPGPPRIGVPGQDGFSLPKTFNAGGLIFLSGSPEIVLTQYPSSKEYNPHGFATFGTIQGLKSNQVRTLLQDKEGNLWFSNEEGVTRYDGKYLTHYSLTNGKYKNNIILCMLQDRSGCLWFGTFGGGAIRFDGKSLIQYTVSEGLSNNIVNCIIQDKDGNFWMGTSGGGISKFDGKTFTHYTEKEGLAGNEIRTICQDHSGNIWVGTFGKGISVFNGKDFRNYAKEEGFPATHLATIFQDKDNCIWFGTYKQGVIKYDGTSFYHYQDIEGISKSTVISIMQDEKGVMWFGTSGDGLFIFDGKTFNNYTTRDGLSSDFIRSSLIGNHGSLWFGTRDGGLIRYNKNLFTHYTNNEGLGGSKVLTVIQDKESNLWFGCYGTGITKFDGKEFSGYSLKETMINDFVYSMLEDEKGNIWIGTDGGGLTCFDGINFVQYTQKEGLCSNSVRCIIKDRNKQIWVGTYGGGVSKFDGRTFVNYTTKEGLSSDKILSMREDKDGTLWFGTDGGGITKLEGKTFTHYTSREGLENFAVSSILQDAKGDHWFGFLGGGIARLKGNELTIFTKKNGLSSNSITSLLEDSKGNIWAGSAVGPNIISREHNISNQDTKEQFDFNNFTYEDGFLGIGCNLGAIFEDKSGIIWIGATNRLSALDPSEVASDTMAPIVRITDIQLFNETIPWLKLNEKKDSSILLGNGMKVENYSFESVSKWYYLPENLKLAYNNNFLTFSFIGISKSYNQKIRYQYRLEGLDLNWSALSNRTEISYGNLKPGNYTFRVQALNSKGIWSNEGCYAFSIASPWWSTKWFYSLLALIIISLIFGIIKLRELEHNMQKKQLQKIIEEQTHALKEKNIELEEKNSELQITNSEKDRMFSIIAHDVRGPLSSFHSLTEAIAENAESFSPSEIKEIMQKMEVSSSNLFELVENLLEWARIQRGLVLLNPKLYKLNELVDSALSTVIQPANLKSVKILTNIKDGLNVKSDRYAVESILRNLISNAVKFTPRGGSITIEAIQSDMEYVQICITDTGIGMDKNMMDDLFRIDVNNNRQGTDGEKSIGLGLLICKDFVEMQGGKIWVESTPGKGSTFCFTVRAGGSL